MRRELCTVNRDPETETPSMPFVTVQNRRVYVEDHGIGMPLLFVHGFPLDHTMWQYQLSAFAASHRVIIPDLPGFGKSDPSSSKKQFMEDFADDLFTLLQELGVAQPVVFCGLSMGGYIAWPFFQKYRDQVAALILCDTRAVGDTPEVARARWIMAAQVVDQGPDFLLNTMLPKLFSGKSQAERPDILEQMQIVVRRNSRNGIAAAQRGMSERPDVTGLLPSIGVPTLVLCGEHDEISPPQEMQEISRSIPDSHYVEIPDAGHMSPLENPTAVNQAIQRFLGFRAADRATGS